MSFLAKLNEDNEDNSFGANTSAPRLIKSRFAETLTGISG